jgi:hypothetical protein
MPSTACGDMSGAYCRLASCAHVDLPTLVRVKWSDFETRHLHDALLANTDTLLDSALAVLDLGHVALARSLAILGSRNLARPSQSLSAAWPCAVPRRWGIPLRPNR